MKNFHKMVTPPLSVLCRLQRWYITIPSLDQWRTTIENHRYQWLPSTILFNGDGNFENHWKFAMVAKEWAKSPTNTTTNSKPKREFFLSGFINT